MGGGKWDSTVYTNATSYRTSNNIPDFGHDDDVKTGKAHGVHADLDPKKVAGSTSLFAGQPIRESRDSAEHPESLPIAIIFDVTGSMGNVPRVLQEKLAKLMDVVIAKAGIKDPQVLVGAIGDYHGDRYPFQVGQFESDNRFDEQLRNIILEGGGGGQTMESYGLAYRFAAHHTQTDSYDKRGKQGYFFTMGDEAFWPTLSRKEIEDVFGIKAEADETVADLLAKASERWEIYHLFANDGGYRNNKDILGKWRKLLGERVIIVEDSGLVCETIASIIHMNETAHSLDDVIKDVGLSGHDAITVKNALVPLANSQVSTNVVAGTLPVGH